MSRKLKLTLSRGATGGAGKQSGPGAIAAFYNRQGDFTKTIEALEARRSSWTRAIPAAPYMTATFYWEKAYKDQRLLPAEKYTVRDERDRRH